MFGNKKAKPEEAKVKPKRNDVRVIDDISTIDVKEATKIDKKELRGKNAIPKSCQEYVPIRRVYPVQKIIEVEEGLYTKQYPIPDINFLPAVDEEQQAIHTSFKKLINYFSSDIVPQVTIYNRTVDKADYTDKLRLRSKKDGLDDLRNEYNNIISQKIAVGKNCTSKEKLLTVSVRADNILVAEQIFQSVDSEVQKRLGNICHKKIEPISVKERLKVLYELFNLDADLKFDEMSFITDDKTDIDYEKLERSGLSCKDLVAPKYYERHNGYLQFGKKFTKSLFLFDVSNDLTEDILSEISSLQTNMLTSVIYQNIDPAEAAKKIHTKQMDIREQMLKQQSKYSAKGADASLISPTLQEEDDDLTITRDQIKNADERMVVVTLCVTVFADTKEELNKFAKIVEDSAKARFCTMTELIGQQDACFISSLPLCINRVETGRQMLTSPAALLIPFEAQDIKHEGGIYMGMNADTHSIVMLNQDNVKPNPHMAVTGASGSGKSFFVKKMIYCNRLSNSNDCIYIIDPENEYSALCNKLNGQVVDIKPAQEGGAHLNVMDMDLQYANTEEGAQNPIGMKSDYLVGFIESLNTSEYPIAADPQITNLIDRYCMELYTPYIAKVMEKRELDPNLTIDYDIMPTILDFYNKARADKNDDRALFLGNILEKCATGTYRNFAHTTDINARSTFVTYNTNQLGKAMKKVGAYIALNDCWNRGIQNFYKGIHTKVIVDEIHTFMKDKATAQTIEEFFKRGRKWNIEMIGITQDLEDMTSTKEGRNVVNNAGIKVSMGQSKAGRDELSDILNLSKAQVAHITTAVPGSGLIACEDSIICFEDAIPKNTMMYSIINTSSDAQVEF